MNCKTGDVAMYVGPFHELHGMVFGIGQFCPEFGGCWYTDPPPPRGRWLAIGLVADASLRPIRDNPGEDETLTWCPIKHKEPA